MLQREKSRRILKEFYSDQFRIAHAVGLHVWFTTTDESSDFFGDLRKIGVDVINVSNPERINVSQMGRLHRNQVCFAVDAERVCDCDADDAFDQLRIVRECLGVQTGGFIAKLGADASPETIRKVHDFSRRFENA